MRSVSEQAFRKRVIQVRREFADLYIRDPEAALKIVSELLRDAIRLDRAFAFGLTDERLLMGRVRPMD
jgi:hypothetical protein